MSICLLCYAFPFYVSAITLARSELSSLSICPCSYVSHSPPFHPPVCALSYPFLIYFSMSTLPLMLPGFSHPGSLFACNGSFELFMRFFPLYSLGRHSAKSSISLRYALFSFVFTFFFSFFFLQAAKLNYVRFDDCFLFSLVRPLVQHLFRAPQR